MIKPHGLFRLSCVLLMLTGLWGCDSTPKVVTPQAYQKPPAQMPTYHQLAVDHNQHVAGLSRLWTKANIDVTYRNDEGKIKHESGDESTLMIELPQNVALSFGKFGLGTLMWAGCDDQHFWFFDLVGEKSMLYGSNASLSQVSIRNLPLQVRPVDIPMLLGLLPLDPNAQGNVGWERGYFTAQPNNGPVKFLFDPISHAVRQVIIFSPSGFPAVVSTLNGSYALPLAGSNQVAYIHQSVRVDVPSEGFTMLAKFTQLTDAKPGMDRAKDKAFARGFDWNDLADRAFKIPMDKRVDLDQQLRQ